MARHVDLVAELAERLPIALVQPVEQVTAGRISERLEYLVVRRNHANRSCRHLD